MADDAARIAELTQRIEELKGQNTEYQTQNALAVVGTHEQLINLQKETAFQTTLLKAEKELQTVTHAATKSRAARYHLLCTHAQFASSMLRTFPNPSEDQRKQLAQRIDAILRGLQLMLTSCTLMDDPCYGKNEPLATYLTEQYTHNMFRAVTNVPLDPKYEGFDCANIDEKIERKMFERAPAELKAEKQAVVVQQQVVQPAMPNPYAYPAFPFPAQPQVPLPQNQHHQPEPPRGGWAHKRPKVCLCACDGARQTYRSKCLCSAVIPQQVLCARQSYRSKCSVLGSHTAASVLQCSAVIPQHMLSKMLPNLC
jgi:hypothetical protein